MSRLSPRSIRTMIVVGCVTYIVVSIVVLCYLSNCNQNITATYIFSDKRGQFEAIVELGNDDRDSILVSAKPKSQGGSDTLNVEDNGSMKKPGCDNFGLPTEIPTTSPGRTCPNAPPSLVGRLDISANTTSSGVFNAGALKLLKPGGFYKPHSCIARERTAIIIPYRDRARHLKLLLFHLHTVLQRQQLQYGIFVVEMAYPTQFNRGLLANVGFLSARDIQNFTCYIIHDVDQLPANDRNLYRCADNPRHLSVSSSKYGFKLPYGHYNGGTVAFTPAQFVRINGFSNSYFGWGKEDDDLHQRILLSQYKVDRPDPDIGVYIEIPHLRDGTNPDNPMKDGLYLNGGSLYKKDGLNSVLYSRLAMEYRPLYTWVYVNTSEALIMGRLQGIYARISKDIRNKAGT